LQHPGAAEGDWILAQQSPSYRAYVAWDLPTRLFHWVNALAVIGLLATRIAILNDDALGFSAEGKVLLKSVHVSFGYVMALNLLWRFVL
jgi:cytochrome b561